MVLPAVLRHPARHSRQTPRRNRTRRLDHRAGVHAVARYVAGAFGKLPSVVPAIFVHLLWRRDWTRLSGGAGADRWLCHRGTHSHDLLFRVLLRDPAVAGTFREDQTGAELDFRIGAAAWCPRRRTGAAASPRTGLRKRSMIPGVAAPVPHIIPKYAALGTSP